MRTRGEIKSRLQVKLLAVGTSTYFTPTRVEDAINDGYIAVGGARQWGEIKKGFITATINGQDYYDYPANCQSESIFKISVDGNSKYDKIDFEDFLRLTEDEPTSERKVFAEYGRQIFIFPTPQTDGTANLIFWGVIQVASLDDDADTTIFTDWADNLNMAILQYAFGDLIQNLDSNKSLAAIGAGDKIITQEFKKIADRLQRKALDRPQFDVPDFFRTNQSNIGQFSIDK
ncbi:MAG: hypothetical protein WA019_00695 [Candidatus Moraniibacteriota bacterium]